MRPAFDILSTATDGAISMKRQLCCFCVLVASASAFAVSAIPQEGREQADLVIAGGTVVTMDADRRVLEDGAIAVRATQSWQWASAPKSKPRTPLRLTSTPGII